nr:basic proline-rich protein-like [Dasypus novemcinctus]
MDVAPPPGVKALGIQSLGSAGTPSPPASPRSTLGLLAAPRGAVPGNWANPWAPSGPAAPRVLWEGRAHRRPRPALPAPRSPGSRAPRAPAHSRGFGVLPPCGAASPARLWLQRRFCTARPGCQPRPAPPPPPSCPRRCCSRSSCTCSSSPRARPRGHLRLSRPPGAQQPPPPPAAWPPAGCAHLEPCGRGEGTCRALEHHAGPGRPRALSDLRQTRADPRRQPAISPSVCPESADFANSAPLSWRLPQKSPQPAWRPHTSCLSRPELRVHCPASRTRTWRALSSGGTLAVTVEPTVGGTSRRRAIYVGTFRNQKAEPPALTPAPPPGAALPVPFLS